MVRSRLLTAGCLALALVCLSSACSALKDQEPWTQTLKYDDHSGEGPLTITPTKDGVPTLEGDASFGEVQVVNNTIKERGFAIDELAVYEKIPAGQTRVVAVNDAKNHRTYRWYDLVNPNEIKGRLVVEFRAKELR